MIPIDIKQVMKAKYLYTLLLFILIFPLDLQAQNKLQGWFNDGQTWLVWEDTPEYTGTYCIYRSASPITDVNQAEMIGRIFREDGEGKLLKKLSDTLHWTIPNGSGGIYTLKDDEILFVFTPKEAESVYFAVLREDLQAITSENDVGPIEQFIDTIQCHLQLSGSHEDFPFRVFAHWISGSENQVASRLDYPVMGNQYFNGTGHLFRIWDYPEGDIPELLPLNVHMHGGGGWFGNFRPIKDKIYKTYMVNAMVFCPDDGVYMLSSGNIKKAKTYWIGYWKDYNRFVEPANQAVPDDGIVVNYTMRRIIWELDWLIESLHVDPERISLMGGSMGARGANYLSRAYPEKFASWLSLSPGIEPMPGDPLLGSATQNLSTNLPGNPGVMDVMDLCTVLTESKRDIPFGKIVGGRNDKSLAGLTADVVQAYKSINNAGMGTHIYWDDRGHVFTEGSYWSDSYRLTSMELNTYRNNSSFPAFFNDDQDFTLPGRQPDIGTGVGDGEIWGTWGGYYYWDPERIVDSSSFWIAEIKLVTSSEYDNDIPAFDSSKTDLSIRNPQHFKPQSGSTIYWTFTRSSDARILQSGQETVGPEGQVIIPDIHIHKDRCEIEISEIPLLHVNANHPGISAKYAGVRIYPNPVSSDATIHYSLAQPGSVSIAIYNTAGQQIESLVNGYKNTGSYTITWKVKSLEPGLYLCRFWNGRTLSVCKFTRQL